MTAETFVRKQHEKCLRDVAKGLGRIGLSNFQASCLAAADYLKDLRRGKLLAERTPRVVTTVRRRRKRNPSNPKVGQE